MSNLQWIGQPGWMGDHSMYYHPKLDRLYVGDVDAHHGDILHHLALEDPQNVDSATPLWVSEDSDSKYPGMLEYMPDEHLTDRPAEHAKRAHEILAQHGIHVELAPEPMSLFGSVKIAAGHVLGWELGHWGKGLIDPGGNVHTWYTPVSDGEPTHPQYVQDNLGIPETDWHRHPAWNTAFQIGLNGHVNIYPPDGEIPMPYSHEEMASMIERADPRLKVESQPHKWDFNSSWHFANATGTWHYNRWSGKVCTCPFNGLHRSLQRFSGPKMDWVMKAPDKALNTPEGLRFKEVLAEKLGDQFDALAPYLAHRYKQGDVRAAYRVNGDKMERALQFWQGGVPYGVARANLDREKEERGMTPAEREERESVYFNPLGSITLANWHNWFQAKQHPLRKGVNIMEKDFTPARFAQIARQHEQAVRREEMAERLKHAGRVVHEFSAREAGIDPEGIDWDAVYNNERETMTRERYNELKSKHEWYGIESSPHIPEAKKELARLRDAYPKQVVGRKGGWHIKQLENSEDAEAEGQMMGHCIGSADQPYGRCLDQGRLTAYSLRDPKGHPHVTMAYNSDGSLAEIYGPNDDPVKDEYQEMLDEWGGQTDHEVDQGNAEGMQEQAEAPHFYFPAADSMESYANFHHPDSSLESAMHMSEGGENGEVGPETSLEWENPEWSGIAEQYLNRVLPREDDPVIMQPSGLTRSQHERNLFHNALGENSNGGHGALYGHPRDMNEALEEHITDQYPNYPDFHPDEQPPPQHWIDNLHHWNNWYNSTDNPEYNGTGQPWEFPGEEPDWSLVTDPAMRGMRERDWKQWHEPITPQADPDLTENNWKLGPGGEGQQTLFSSAWKTPWPYQQGLCGTYAATLIHMNPHLRLGVAGQSTEGGWNPTHYYAHDDTYAYDSLGSHPLPYHGIDGSLDVSIPDYNTPEDEGLIEAEGGPDGGADNVAKSRAHILATDPLHHPYGQVLSHGKGLVKTADKYHDFLMNPKSRPDLQTPEAQEWLKDLKTFHHEKTDELFPWLTREWKKGRIMPAGYGALAMETNENHDEDGPGVGIVNRRDIHHWGDFMKSGHPLRREMGDIMQHKSPEFFDRIKAWDQAMEDERSQQAAAGGEVVHQWPDGWSVRRLHTPEELESEGDAMGHCVGSYANEVGNGRTMIYSLRDAKGQPHVTTEIEPHLWDESDHPFDPDDYFHLHQTLRHAPEYVKQMIRDYASTPYDAREGWQPHPTDASAEQKFDEDGNLMAEGIRKNKSELGEQRPEDWENWGNAHKENIEQLFNQVHNMHLKHSRKPIPDKGHVIQIMGKANRDPEEEYKKRLRQWFETWPVEKRPVAEGEDDYLSDPEDIQPSHYQSAGEPNEYGLLPQAQPNGVVAWDSMLENIIPHRGYGGNYADEIYDLAKARKEIPELGKKMQPWRENVWDNFEKLREQNLDYMYDHTGPHPEMQEDSWIDDYGDEHKGWSEKTTEEQDKDVKAYEERERDVENELMREHPESAALEDMTFKMKPHENPQTGTWHNDLAEAQPEPLTPTPNTQNDPSNL